MRLAARGHDVLVADNYLRRTLAKATSSEALITTPNLTDRAAIYHAVSSFRIEVEIGDCTNQPFLDGIFQRFQPDAVVHFAEQPSAPYSMMGYDQARQTLMNNVGTTFNVIWSVLQHAPHCHIVKFGTLGGPGTPDIDIEEGWIEISHKGRTTGSSTPTGRQPVPHDQILDTDLLWLTCTNLWTARVGPDAGPHVPVLATTEADLDARWCRISTMTTSSAPC